MTTASDLPAGRPAAVHDAAPGAPWWRRAVIYQIYPRSFADSGGDGVGDLPGITGRLDHLARLGVDAVWVSPFYRSPQADFGYDVADYRDVDPGYGTLRDADALIGRAHELGLRVIVDLVPNHTSSEHPWFRAALAAPPGSPERERFIFRNGRGAAGQEPPNDWPSMRGGTAWTRVPGEDGTPGQWYLHLFDAIQPDLNWSNPEVHEEFRSVLRFWLERGVDGFRIDVAHGLVKADGLPDIAGASIRGPGRQTLPMWNQDGVHEIYRDWRRIADSYGAILVAEAWVGPPPVLAQYVRPDELHQAFNFEYLLAPWSAAELREVIEKSLRSNDAVGAPTTWVLSNHDVVRHPTRLAPADAAAPGAPAGDPAGPEPAGGRPALRRGRAATLLMLALPGAAYLYQGEELGLPEYTDMPDEARKDPVWELSGHTRPGRDGCRIPLPWRDGGPSFGFSTSEQTWLPQPPWWGRYALDRQVGVAGSTYEMYREALRLRRELGLGCGSLAWWHWPPGGGSDGGADGADGDGAVAFVNNGIGVIANLGSSPVRLPEGAQVLCASVPLGHQDADGGRPLVPPDVTVWARLRT
jgi:alpha-glucosidase